MAKNKFFCNGVIFLDVIKQPFCFFAHAHKLILFRKEINLKSSRNSKIGTEFFPKKFVLFFCL